MLLINYTTQIHSLKPREQQQINNMGKQSSVITDRRPSSHFFEGVEKLLKIWFNCKDGHEVNCDLRLISRGDWEKMLDVVGCQIIGFTCNESIDAYVLSESSMFVSKRWILLKTCGETTPLLCLKFMLRLVQQYTGFDEVQDLFYSRKNYKRPELQQEPHRSFTEEAALLDSIFLDGAAYCLGAGNRDCWYLYTLNPSLSVSSGHSLRSLLSTGFDDDLEIAKDNVDDSFLDKADDMNAPEIVELIAEPEETVEVIMSDLDPEVMKIFTRKISSTAAEATRKSEIDKILPNVTIDDYLFDPCGYSMNGIFEDGQYMTIHITPEPAFSYVSFESSKPQSSAMELILRVLDMFRPKKFIVTVFARSSVVEETEDIHINLLSALHLGGFQRREIQYLSCKNCDLTYALYSK